MNTPQNVAVSDPQPAYYSVKNPILLNGVKKTPNVCYPIEEGQLANMKTIAQSGAVILYNYPVRFVNGQPYRVSPSTGKAVANPVITYPEPQVVENEFSPYKS